MQPSFEEEVDHVSSMYMIYSELQRFTGCLSSAVGKWQLMVVTV